MHVGVLNKLLVVDLRLHGRLLAEEVVGPVHLSWSGRARGVADGEAEAAGKVFSKHVDQSALVAFAFWQQQQNDTQKRVNACLELIVYTRAGPGRACSCFECLYRQNGDRDYE